MTFSTIHMLDGPQSGSDNIESTLNFSNKERDSCGSKPATNNKLPEKTA